MSRCTVLLSIVSCLPGPLSRSEHPQPTHNRLSERECSKQAYSGTHQHGIITTFDTVEISFFGSDFEEGEPVQYVALVVHGKQPEESYVCHPPASHLFCDHMCVFTCRRLFKPFACGGQQQARPVEGLAASASPEATMLLTSHYCTLEVIT